MQILLLFYCVAVMWMAPVLSENSTLCCYAVFRNNSAIYILSDMRCKNSTWDKDNIPIKDDDGNTNKEIVLNSGPYWILLNRQYLNIDFKCLDNGETPIQCQDTCESRKFGNLTEGHGDGGAKAGDRDHRDGGAQAGDGDHRDGRAQAGDGDHRDGGAQAGDGDHRDGGAQAGDGDHGEKSGHKDDGVSKTNVLIGVFVPIIIIFISIIIWKKDFFRTRCANRQEANNANQANGDFQAVDLEDQQESSM